ncbi:proteoglycan 4-like [Nothobranchius furzeri]|uniref:proteoglycan 4-like n=1 Tax=Nothobranchius furzeri TaxID=105023 RepID=UPI003904A109
MCRRRGELQVPEIQALPQNTGTPRRLQPERPPPPSRGTEDCPGGPQPAASRVPGDISGKPTGPPAASHPLAGRARDPGATTPARDPAEPRDPDPTRQPPGSTRQAPKILNPLTRELRTVRQTKAPHPTPGVSGEGRQTSISSKEVPGEGRSQRPHLTYTVIHKQSHTLPPSCSHMHIQPKSYKNARRTPTHAPHTHPIHPGPGTAAHGVQP